MGSSVIDQDYPYDILHRGKSDESRHNKRINDAVKKQLKDIISQQDIITSEGNKKVKVKLKYLDQYRFRYNKDRMDEVGRDEFDDLTEGEELYRPQPGEEGGAGNEAGEEVYETEYTIEELTDMMIEELGLPDLRDTPKSEIVSDVLEWTDRRKETGVVLDKKKTILSNILRRAKQKQHKIIPFIKDDLRYRAWNVVDEKHSNAVVFLMMDRSGSMSEERIYAVKSLYFWIVQFLRRKYDRVDIKFIAHDTVAREMQEQEFFSIASGGGTSISSAYQLCREMIKYNYPSALWNIYCFHASDGDTYGDETECVKNISEIVALGAALFAYAEVTMDGPDVKRQKSRLITMIEKHLSKQPEVSVYSIGERKDILTALENFLRHSTRNAYA